jgi:outer membrane protein TolC
VKRAGIAAAGATFLLTVLSGATAHAGTLPIDLESAVSMTVRNSNLVSAAHIGEEKAAVMLKRARAEYLPESELTVETGVVPAARGTAVDSPDEMDSLDSLGGFYKVGLEVVQPLYTFGRLSHLEQTAREGIGAAVARTGLEVQEMSLLAIRTYWQLSSARRALDVADELRESFNTLVAEVETRLADEDSEIDDSSLMEVKSSTYRIEKTFLDAGENLRVAGVAMRALIGSAEGETFETADEKSPELGFGISEIERHLVEKGISTKEVELLEAAARVMESNVNLIKSDRYPVVFLAAGAGHARAPNRDDQTNPFVVDNFNYSRLGAEVGLKWKPNIYKKNLEVEEMEKEHAALLESIEALKRKVAVEASEALGGAARNRNLLKAARVSLTASKSWLRLSLDNWEMGFGEVKRLIDAYEAYYTMKAVEIDMELQYNLSLARVADALGDVALYLEWVKSGAVDL